MMYDYGYELRVTHGRTVWDFKHGTVRVPVGLFRCTGMFPNLLLVRVQYRTRFGRAETY